MHLADYNGMPGLHIACAMPQATGAAAENQLAVTPATTAHNAQNYCQKIPASPTVYRAHTNPNRKRSATPAAPTTAPPRMPQWYPSTSDHAPHRTHITMIITNNYA